MNLRSLNFLNSLRHTSKQFAVIGLGRFGRSVSGALHEMGHEILGTDIEEKLVAQVLAEKTVSHAIQLDSRDPLALKEAGIFEFDTVIVAIGNYLEESIITTLNLKEAGVAHVVAKASTEIHGKLLQRVGADRVVFPEYEAGCALAYNLTKPSVLDCFDLDPDHSIVEVRVPEEFHNKTIAELELRSSYGLTLLAVSEDDKKFQINPLPTQRLHQGAAMVVLGSNKSLKRLPI
ncbi:TrkA family potassium uptake protein [Lusitaniella coriacea LEGE 07157]|uniref:TrkA family potassium uptake protein n=1 Tax=Lusitaniella coriacea LEGE 07157 TaxID=945747 RepID=A0A8J7IUM0_9CYAN|nr:TrkA family potassium uptake protein [Lusitaniella coriacea LEGE 07157]